MSCGLQRWVPPDLRRGHITLLMCEVSPSCGSPSISAREKYVPPHSNVVAIRRFNRPDASILHASALS
jgi:hypothetical protein